MTNVPEMILDEDKKYYDMFVKRLAEHRDRINKYASKIGKNYPDHDMDKFVEPLSSVYYLDKKRDFVPITPDETETLRQAGIRHRSNNPHHPEFWDKEHINNITDIRYHPTSLFNCTNMPISALEEMCADWCAMAEELGNDPFEWFERIKGKRYIFTDEQNDFILKTLHQMWD